MAVVSGQTKRFAAASPVTRYWLANCTGFSLVGGSHGTVERVITDGDPFFPVQLEIRQGNRLRRLSTAAVMEVIPAEQVLVVRGSDRALAQREALDRAGVVLGQVAVAVGILLLGVAMWLVRSGKEIARLVRSLSWQQYGRSARSGTTRLWREISTTWSRLLTTSSEQSNAKSSSERARSTSST